MKTNFEVIVGNIGSVYSGNSMKEALQRFASYKEDSKHLEGSRCYGEDVVIMKNGEIWREYNGHINEFSD